MTPKAAPRAPTPQAPGGAADLALDELDLPTRMARWAQRNGLTTMCELARFSPASLHGERNVGRRSIKDTRAILEERLGVTWEDFAAEEPATATRHGPLPLDAADLALDRLALPTRMANWVRRRGISTLHELARISPADLLTEQNVGRLTIRQTRVVIEPHLGVSWEIAAGERSAVRVRREELAAAAERRAAHQEALVSMPLLDAWRVLLLKQSDRERTVVEAHAGLGGHAERLHLIAGRLGLAKSTVSRMETRAVADLTRERAWLAAVLARAEVALTGGAAPLATLAGDPWWAGIVALPGALDYFGEQVLAGAWRVVRLEDRPYLARCSQELLDEARRALEAGAARTLLPAPLATLRALLDPWEPRIHAVLAEALFERLRALLLVDETDGPPRVTALLSEREVSILATLRASPAPVRVTEVPRRLSWSRMPGDVLRLGHGLIGLPQHFPSYTEWRERLVPAAIGVMERGAPERQWLSIELREQLREDQGIPDWLTEWHLGSLLQRSGKVRCLGRMKFVLAGAPAGQGSVGIRGELVRLLRERGGPMMRRELIADLRRRTSANEASVNLCLSHPPFLRLERNCYGLVDRDLPGRGKARAKAAVHVAALLEQRGRGLGAASLQAAIAGLSPAHARWTPMMCLSALRGDPRFQHSTSGAVGLSSWESVRLPTREELLRRCLERAGGRVPLATVERRIKATYGEPPNPNWIGMVASTLGLRVRKGWIERVEAPAD